MERSERSTIAPLGLPKGHIRGFDGLRAISVILVIAAHSGIYLLLPERPYFRSNLYEAVSGTAGVQTFFVLSGYLITGSLLRERYAGGRILVGHFYLRRALRLFPALLLFFAVLLVRHWTQGIVVPKQGVLMAIFYVYNFIPVSGMQGMGGLIDHMWSLSLEEQFYLLWPLALVLCSLQALQRIGIGVVLLCALVAHQLSFWPVNVDGTVHPLWQIHATHHWFIPAVAPILIGAMTATLLVTHREVCRVLLSSAYTPLVAILLYLAPVYVNDLFLQFNVVAIPRACGVALLLAWLHQHPGSWSTRVLEWRPLAYIGRISYGLYLFHPLFIGSRGHYRMFASYPLCLAALLVFAIASFELYERPILRLKDRWAAPVAPRT